MIIPREKLSKVSLPTVESIQPSILPISASRGIGDSIAKILKPFVKGTRLENCKGCQKRQDKLNELLPYTPRKA